MRIRAYIIALTRVRGVLVACLHDKRGRFIAQLFNRDPWLAAVEVP